MRSSYQHGQRKGGNPHLPPKITRRYSIKAFLIILLYMILHVKSDDFNDEISKMLSAKLQSAFDVKKCQPGFIAIQKSEGWAVQLIK